MSDKTFPVELDATELQVLVDYHLLYEEISAGERDYDESMRHRDRAQALEMIRRTLL